METLHSLSPNKKMLLSASSAGLCLHTMHNEQFLRPALLCGNYESGLCSTLYRNSVYYCYVTKDRSLLLRCLQDSSVLFRLDGTVAVTYHSPQLIVFRDTLFLFYFEADEASYRLRWQCPFAEEISSLPPPLPTHFPALPSLHIYATNESLYLFLSTDSGTFSFRCSSFLSFETLSSEKELLSTLRIPWDEEKKEMEQTLLQTIQLSGRQQNMLAEKEHALQHSEATNSKLTDELHRTRALLSKTESDLQTIRIELTKCEEQKQQAELRVQHASRLLERAKTQYNELMQVAEQYRQEAVKWYGKFTDRH